MTAKHQSKDKPNGNRKYFPADVARWRKIMREERLNQKELAKRVGVPSSMVSALLQEF